MASVGYNECDCDYSKLAPPARAFYVGVDFLEERHLHPSSKFLLESPILDMISIEQWRARIGTFNCKRGYSGFLSSLFSSSSYYYYQPRKRRNASRDHCWHFLTSWGTLAKCSLWWLHRLFKDQCPLHHYRHHLLHALLLLLIWWFVFTVSLSVQRYSHYSTDSYRLSRTDHLWWHWD